jgi:hypothetical protein
MPPGRPTNYDAKIARLVKDLRKTLVAREAARIEASVSKHVDALVASMSGAHPVHAMVEMVKPATDAAVAFAKKIGRKGRSAASRAVQAAKMKAYWAKRKAKEAMGGKPAKSPAAAMTKPKAPRPKSAGRARQVAAMKAYWAKKKAAKAKAGMGGKAEAAK